MLKVPLAQLVEHLTLNQGVRGSSPRWRTKRVRPEPLGSGRIFIFHDEIQPEKFGNQEYAVYLRKTHKTAFWFYTILTAEYNFSNT